MKLLLCYDCYDVKKLAKAWRTCKCGKVRAKYLNDGKHAEWNGHGVLLGIHNTSLAEALMLQRDEGDRPDGLGHRFEAFVIPTKAPSVAITRKK